MNNVIVYIKTNNITELKNLLKHDKNLFNKYIKNIFIIHFLVKRKQVKINVNYKNNYNKYLYYAINIKSNINLIKLILDNIDTDELNSKKDFVNYDTLLHYLIYESLYFEKNQYNLNIIKLLLNYNLKFNIRNKYDQDALTFSNEFELKQIYNILFNYILSKERIEKLKLFYKK
jgi:hypothetical protein